MVFNEAVDVRLIPRGASFDHRAADFALLEHHHIVTALLQRERSLATRRARAHNGDVLRRFGLGVELLVIMEQRGIGRARNGMMPQNAAVGAADLTTDAGTNIFLVAGTSLLDPCLVGQALARGAHEVDLAIGENLLGGLGRLNGAGHHNGNMHLLLHFGGHVGAIRPRIEARGEVRRHMRRGNEVQKRHAFALEHLAGVDALVQANAVGLAVVHVELHAHRIIRADVALDGANDFNQEALAIEQRAAVDVVSLVVVRREEVARQAAARTVDFHQIEASLLHAQRGFAVLIFDLVNLINGQRTRNRRASIDHDLGQHRRRRNGVVAAGKAHVAARMRELHARDGAVVVHRLGEHGKPRNVGVVIGGKAHVIAFHNKAVVQKHDARAALGSFSRMLQVAVRQIAGLANIEIRAHGIANHAILHRELADLAFGKQVRIFRMLHSEPPCSFR